MQRKELYNWQRTADFTVVKIDAGKKSFFNVWPMNAFFSYSKPDMFY